VPNDCFDFSGFIDRMCNGKFTAPDITMQEMINKCVEIMVLRNIMPEKQAKDFMTDRMPKLKRWMK
jgi:hypothetical protein